MPPSRCTATDCLVCTWRYTDNIVVLCSVDNFQKREHLINVDWKIPNDLTHANPNSSSTLWWAVSNLWPNFEKNALNDILWYPNLHLHQYNENFLFLRKVHWKMSTSKNLEMFRSKVPKCIGASINPKMTMSEVKSMHVHTLYAPNAQIFAPFGTPFSCNSQILKKVNWMTPNNHDLFGVKVHNISYNSNAYIFIHFALR